jgi:hypothetical protein
MGEGRIKNRKGSEIVARETRCIYCAGPSETVEHMPPRSMFRAKHRPGAMEFGACKVCNEGTRGADIAAAVIARLHPDHGDLSWQSEETRGLIRPLDAFAPGVREEMIQPGTHEARWVPRRDSGLLHRAILVRARGPRLQAYLRIFAAKLAMALFREHTGSPLALDGAVWCQFLLNAGVTQEYLESLLSMLPGLETLRQGSKNVSDQFNYRYNTDERTVVAAVSQFHLGLWLTTFASTDPRIIDLLAKPEFVALPASAFVRPGELLSLLPPPLTPKGTQQVR